MSINTEQAKQKLIDGNQRFINDTSLNRKFLINYNNNEGKPQQKPFAIILGCSDSRVPIETIFDQSFGDLFIIRIAGNIVASSQLGSIEFAVSQFNSPLIVVLGHSFCGAVTTSVDEFINKSHLSDNLHSITDRIMPCIEPLTKLDLPRDELIDRAVKLNVDNSVKRLYKKSNFIKEKVNDKSLTIVGATYCLNSGLVTF